MARTSCPVWLAPRLLRPIKDYTSARCSYRAFTSSGANHAEAVESQESGSAQAPLLDPNLVSTHFEERQLVRDQHQNPIGSRRRRALAKLYPDSLPFEQLPYQCFQEARKILAADREAKLKQIGEMRARIARSQEIPSEALGGDYVKKGKLIRMQKHLEELKILADINDPLVKKKFEDGQGDMDRPVYRHLADKKWREYKRNILLERISSFHLVPDIFSHLDPTVDVDLAWGRTIYTPGEFIDPRISEQPPRLRIQPFDKGERLVSIAVMDADVPDEEHDTYTSRCHYLAVNIPVSPTNTSVQLVNLNKDNHVILPWLPPFSQKGSPYHRLPMFVFQQQDGEMLEVNKLRTKFSGRDGWALQKFTQPNKTTTVGVNIFRTKWDENADAVAQRAGIQGANIEWVRKKAEKLPYKKKDGARFR